MLSPAPLRRLHTNRQRGSVLVLTLLTTAILAIAVAAMLYNVREVSRSTANKVTYEESYHVALAGVQMTKGWLSNVALAKAQLGTKGDELEAITSGSVELVTEAAKKKREEDNPGWAESLTPDQIAAFFSVSGGASLEGGARKVLWEWEGDILSFERDANTTPTGDLLTAIDDVRSRVTKIRITTPYCSVGGANAGDSTAGRWVKDNVLQTSLIIEAEAKTDGTGPQKTRWLQQKLIVGPTISYTSTEGTTTTTTTVPESDSPPLSPGGAIVSGGSVALSGSSQLNVHWGPVQVKGDIDMVGISNPMSVNAGTGAMSLSAQANDKLYAAGLADPDFGSGNPKIEKWVKWQASGSLYKKQGGNQIPVFPDINGVPVTDYYAQLINTGFGDPDKYNLSKLTLSNNFIVSPTGGEGVYYGPVSDTGFVQMGTGSFVQHWAPVATIVDNVIENDLNYDVWKAYAIAKNGYARPGTGGYVDHQNVPLWVKSDRTLIAANAQPTGTSRFQNLKQVSMEYLVPKSGADTGNTSQIIDQVLFIDTQQGTKSGTPVNLTLNSSDDFFWKGLFYINGSLHTSGAGGFATIRMKNPDDYAADPKGNTTGILRDGCYMDGIVYASGVITRNGNSSIYGTMVSNGSDSGGGPEVFYNSRAKFGLFQPQPETHEVYNPPTDQWFYNKDLKRWVTGPIRELNAWPG